MPQVRIHSKTVGIDLDRTSVEVDLDYWRSLQKRMKKRKPRPIDAAPPTYLMKPHPNPRGELVIRASCDTCGKKAWLSVPEAERVLNRNSGVVCKSCLDKSREAF